MEAETATDTNTQGKNVDHTTPTKGKSTPPPTSKQNGESGHKHVNGESTTNGSDEPAKELRRSSRVIPVKKKEEPKSSTDPKESGAEVEIVKDEEEKGDELSSQESEKILSVSFTQHQSSEMDNDDIQGPSTTQVTSTPIVPPSLLDAGRLSTGRISARRPLRNSSVQSVSAKRKIEDDAENESTPSKKRSLEDSWIVSPGWRYLATPFRKLWNSKPACAPPESDSMIVQYDERTIDCHADITTDSIVTEPATPKSSKWSCNLM